MTRWRVPLGFLFAAWYLVVARPDVRTPIGVALALILSGCLLRSWAAGYLLKGKRVAVGGPYAWIRNPLYVGSFLIGTGFSLMLWQWPPSFSVGGLWLAFLVGFGVLYRAKTLAEEKELFFSLGDAYASYSRQVPAFLPFRGRVRGLGEQRFSWELYMRNREYECLAGGLALLVYLYWKSGLWA